MTEENQDRRSWCCSRCKVTYELRVPRSNTREWSRCYCGLRHWSSSYNDRNVIQIGTTDADLEKHLQVKRGGE